MTLTGGDPRVLAAAAKIRDAAANLGVVDRRVADEALRDCPALAAQRRFSPRPEAKTSRTPLNGWLVGRIRW